MEKDYDIIKYMREQSGWGWTNMLPDVEEDTWDKYIVVSIFYLLVCFEILCYLAAISRIQDLFQQAIPTVQFHRRSLGRFTCIQVCLAQCVMIPRTLIHHALLCNRPSARGDLVSDRDRGQG